MSVTIKEWNYLLRRRAVSEITFLIFTFLLFLFTFYYWWVLVKRKDDKSDKKLFTFLLFLTISYFVVSLIINFLTFREWIMLKNQESKKYL